MDVDPATRMLEQFRAHVFVALSMFTGYETPFQLFDKSHSGRVSFSEFQAGCFSVHFLDYVAKLFRMLDMRGDGFLTPRSFQKRLDEEPPLSCQALARVREALDAK